MQTKVSQVRDRKEGAMQAGMLTLIVARPGRMRDSLQSLLAAAPLIDEIDQADDGASALRILERCPTLVLLDTNLPGGQVWEVLAQIRAQQPHTRCLVLADSARQRQMAWASGADDVLLKGFQTAELFAAIEKVLSKELC